MSPSIAKKVLQFFSHKNVILVMPESNDYQLSDEREKEILLWMLEGHNYKTIAEKAFISYETVRTHVKKIYKKLHVASRSEAIMKAYQQGYCLIINLLIIDYSMTDFDRFCCQQDRDILPLLAQF